MGTSPTCGLEYSTTGTGEGEGKELVIRAIVWLAHLDASIKTALKCLAENEPGGKSAEAVG